MRLPVPFARTRSRGFTLIEILIALVVLFIGIVGIIALFPIGIESTRSSVQDTNAALIAESIHHSIILAMRNANAAGEAWIVHDGAPLQTAGVYNKRCAYRLALTDGAGNPLVAALPGENNHPTAAVVYASGGPSPDIFQLARDFDKDDSGGDDSFDPMRSTVEDIRGSAITAEPSAVAGSDPTIDYNQYFWNFYVGQVVDSAGVRLPLYQFRIRIWRGYQNGSYNHVTDNDPNGLPPEFIQEFRVLVASNS